MRSTFEIMVERFERFQYSNGVWTYQWDKQWGAPRSMICVGLLGLAIGRGLKISTSESHTDAEKDVHVLKGLSALRQYIGKPTGHMNKREKLPDLYFLWSLERVGMLYNLPTIGDRDWYRWGAEILVANQLKDGRWPPPAPNKKIDYISRIDYKPVLNTAFALLFLKRSHPMKDLTPILPFTAKELNEEIARLRPSDSRLERSTITPSRNTKSTSEADKP